jgi:hypothetical protein
VRTVGLASIVLFAACSPETIDRRVDALSVRGSFSLGAPTAIGRKYGRAYTADANHVVSMGGGGGAGEVIGDESTIDFYDVAADRWSTSPAAPFAGGAAAYTGQIDRDNYLIFGGGNAIPFDLPRAPDFSSWIYNLPSKSWTRTGDVPPGLLLASFSNTALIRLQDGRFLAAGGLSEVPHPSDVSLVFTFNRPNPAASSWDYTRDAQGNQTRMNRPRTHGHQSLLLPDGRVLIVSGIDYPRFDLPNELPNSASSQSAEIFDPSTGLWTAVPDVMPPISGEEIAGDLFPGSRKNFEHILLADGRVLICGGFTVPISADGQLLGDPDYVFETERSSCLFFDPARIDQPGGPWSLAAPMPTGRTDGTLLDLGARGLLLYGGYDTNFDYFEPIPGWNGRPETFLYDQKTNRWSPGPIMPSIDLGDGSGLSPLVILPSTHGAVLPNGSVIISGGFFSLATFTYPAPETQIFSPGLPLVAAPPSAPPPPSSLPPAARAQLAALHRAIHGK